MTGLRERKRLEAMTRIQGVALDLFARRGYDAVSMTEVAAAADVAERTVYRYFGTKEMLVAYDARDAVAIEAMTDLVPTLGLLGAARRTLEALDELTLESVGDERTMTQLRLLTEEPALSAAFAQVGRGLGDALGAGVAAAAGLPADDLGSRAQAHALVAALTVALQDWYARGGTGDVRAALLDAVDAVGRLA